jgi:hypothetical protein
MERFVEGALVDGAVAEEAEADLVGAAQPDPVADAGGDGEVASHDAVPPEVAGGRTTGATARTETLETPTMVRPARAQPILT